MFSAVKRDISHINQDNSSSEFASFGAIHLNITNIERSTLFWTKLMGMKLREASDEMAEFGTEAKTLVAVHEVAKTKFLKGYSGLYHVAIHAPNKEEFASMLNRLNSHDYPYSPVDHTMSKSIYLDDPDGINVEFTLETPERFKRIITQGGFKIEDAQGNIRGVSEYLNVKEVLANLVDKDINKPLHTGTSIGHLHLYANNVQSSNAFYQEIGFTPSNYFPEMMFADLGAGGPYKHRIALNSWHGINKPLAPSDSAGMRHFQLIFKTKEMVNQALRNITDYEEKDGGYWFNDPTGNKIFLNNL